MTSGENDEEFLLNFNNPHFKEALLASIDQIPYLNNFYKQKSTIKICKEIIFSRQFVIYCKKHSFLVHSFDDANRKFIENGMIDHWRGFNVKFMKPKI